MPDSIFTFRSALTALITAAIFSLSAGSLSAQTVIYPEWAGNQKLPAPYIISENGNTNLVFTNINPAYEDIDVKIPYSALGLDSLSSEVFFLHHKGKTLQGIPEEEGSIWFRIPADTTSGSGTEFKYRLVDVTDLPMDTTYMDYPADCTMKVHLRHDYTKTLVTKLFLSNNLFDGRYKHAGNGKQSICINFEQALERIKALDCLTLGMPKITYLVGWQYDGHDSKYPAFFEGNEALKRPCDANALESVKWLMQEGRKYNTTVSLHINMFDCYEDSPLFEKYLKGDILARNRAGFIRYSDWGYKVDYVQEWNSGFARERIDSLCGILPIQEAGSIHIDAFHTSIPVPVEMPDGSFKIKFDTVLSPHHGWTLAEETAAQIEIFKYWDSKGVDVTTEGLDAEIDGDTDPHIGYRPMIWHYASSLYTRYPASMLTGGDNGDPVMKRVFGSNDDLESLLKSGDPDYKEVTRRLCTSSFIANYLNRHERKVFIHNPAYGKVEYSDGLVAEATNVHYTVTKNGITLVEDDDILIPALWVGDNALVAYSSDGYRNRTWYLLPEFQSKGKATVYAVDENGRHLLKSVSYSNGRIRLSVNPKQMLLILLNQ